MSRINLITGDMVVSSGRFAIVAARFNSFIVEPLIAGAQDMLIRHGAAEKDITVVRVPGSFEIPLVLKRLADSGRYDGLIALGAVIRGATPHFDHVAGECVKGIAAVSLASTVPVGFGVLTVDTLEQAIERAGTKAGNKGADAAATVIEMVSLLKKLEK